MSTPTQSSHMGPKSSTHPIETWEVRKPAVVGARGVVASQNIDAALAGASWPRWRGRSPGRAACAFP